MKPESGSQQQAAQRLGIDRTSMVARIDALEDKGLVSRDPHAEDRRRNVVELTNAGHDTVRQAALHPRGPRSQWCFDADSSPRSG